MIPVMPARGAQVDVFKRTGRNFSRSRPAKGTGESRKDVPASRRTGQLALTQGGKWVAHRSFPSTPNPDLIGHVYSNTRVHRERFEQAWQSGVGELVEDHRDIRRRSSPRGQPVIAGQDPAEKSAPWSRDPESAEAAVVPRDTRSAPSGRAGTDYYRRSNLPARAPDRDLFAAVRSRPSPRDRHCPWTTRS